MFEEEGGSGCMLRMCVSLRGGHSPPPCLPFLLDPLPLHPTPNPPPLFTLEIKQKAFCRLSACSAAELHHSTEFIFTEKSPLPGLAS